MQIGTWRAPVTSIGAPAAASFFRSISRPMTNSRTMRPISATVWMLASAVAHPPAQPARARVLPDLRRLLTEAEKRNVHAGSLRLQREPLGERGQRRVASVVRNRVRIAGMDPAERDDVDDVTRASLGHV